MKTNRLLRVIVGCFVCAAGALTMSCTDTTIPGGDKQLPDKHDTTTLVDTLLPFGVHRITIGAAGGEQEVEFAPSGDWTFTSSTAWLKVTTAAGKAADKVLKFTADRFDQVGGYREAITTITVGGVARTVKFTQNGTPRFVHIYDIVNTVNDDFANATGSIRNILSNVDLEIASSPDWLKSIELVKDPTVDTQYLINYVVVRPDFDSRLRSGIIVLRDKNFPEFTYDLPFDYDASVARYIATPGFAKDFVFDGVVTGKEASGTFSISTKPEQEECMVFYYGRETTGSFTKTPIAWAKAYVPPVEVSMLAAYTNVEYEFALTEYTEMYGDASRTAYVLAVPVSELNPTGSAPLEVKDAYQVMSITQKRAPKLEMIDPIGTGPLGSMFSDKVVLCAKGAQITGPGVPPGNYKLGVSDLTTYTLKIKAVKGIVPQIKVPDIPAITTGSATQQENAFTWDGTIDLGTPVTDGAFDNYTVTVTCNSKDYTPKNAKTITFKILVSADPAWDPNVQSTGNLGCAIPLVYKQK